MRLGRLIVPIFFALSVLASPTLSVAQMSVSITVGVAPPPIPVYAQPPIPDEGYLWVPGYWAWERQGYYWVPGTWVHPPEAGLLWTPGYWEFAGNAYRWHPGYWGPQVGYYGGINYGFGYFGIGFVGGFWDHDAFRYNAAVNNFGSRRIKNVYRQTPANVGTSRAAFAGGRGGTARQPSAEDQRAVTQQRREPTAPQIQQERAAGTYRTQNATVNHARPPVAATPRPGQFSGPGVTPARSPAAARQAPAAHAAPAAPQAHPAPAARRQAPEARPAPPAGGNRQGPAQDKDRRPGG